MTQFFGSNNIFGPNFFFEQIYFFRPILFFTNFFGPIIFLKQLLLDQLSFRQYSLWTKLHLFDGTSSLTPTNLNLFRTKLLFNPNFFLFDQTYPFWTKIRPLSEFHPFWINFNLLTKPHIFGSNLIFFWSNFIFLARTSSFWNALTAQHHRLYQMDYNNLLPIIKIKI